MDQRAWVIAALVLGAVVVAGGLGVWFVLQSHSSGSGSLPTAPCPSCLAATTPSESRNSTAHLYRFTIAQVPAGLTWADVSVAVLDASGSRISTDAVGWNVSVLSSSGTLVAACAMSATSPHWTMGGSATVDAGDLLNVASPLDVPLSGDQLSVRLAAPFTGTTLISIP
ncbi:MAG TPA: hypothetical protein VLY85_01155 [Thermoplasmata archaeon]|nr:hypothetical protein [Thermoplasmata archaeon]